MNRSPKGIYTYGVLINKVTTQGFDMEGYDKIPGLYNSSSNPLWGKKSDKLEFIGEVTEELITSD